MNFCLVLWNELHGWWRWRRQRRAAAATRWHLRAAGVEAAASGAQWRSSSSPTSWRCNTEVLSYLHGNGVPEEQSPGSNDELYSHFDRQKRSVQKHELGCRCFFL